MAKTKAEKRAAKLYQTTHQYERGVDVFREEYQIKLQRDAYVRGWIECERELIKKL